MARRVSGRQSRIRPGPGSWPLVPVRVLRDCRLVKISGTETAIAAAWNKNATAGDTAVHRIPATALAARLAPAWAVASSPNAEPRRLAGARAATAADSAVSPRRSPGLRG
jgi:hypothetical protein